MFTAGSRLPAMPAAHPDRRRWPAVLGYGFRPFFLLAGIHAVLAIPLWLSFLSGAGFAMPALAPLAWHAHEMLFGFVAAAVAGFLLTAVPSWTGQRGYAGMPLLALALLWISGRVVLTAPTGLTPFAVAVVDLAFLPALALTILPALRRSGNRRNLVFIGLLATLFASNLHFHLAGAGKVEPLMLAVNVVLLMVALVGGRILPAFTSSGLKRRGLDVRIRRYPLIDNAALAATLAVVLIDLVLPRSIFAAAAAACAALLLALRMSRWQGHRGLKDPLIWVLHLAYLWLPVGLALKAAWLFGAAIPDTSWLHALTAGAFSTMILAVMSRASLGHTGRELSAPGPVVGAYYLIGLAAAVRVFGPMLPVGAGWSWMVASGTLWSLAFLLFCVVYAPILCSPRVDGRPG
jgi:uncharacterized protein involved in response to NO